jgi:hypothetical protein
MDFVMANQETPCIKVTVTLKIPNVLLIVDRNHFKENSDGRRFKDPNVVLGQHPHGVELTG